MDKPTDKPAVQPYGTGVDPRTRSWYRIYGAIGWVSAGREWCPSSALSAQTCLYPSQLRVSVGVAFTLSCSLMIAQTPGFQQAVL